MNFVMLPESWLGLNLKTYQTRAGKEKNMKELKQMLLIAAPAVIAILVMMLTRKSYIETIQPKTALASHEIIRHKQPEDDVQEDDAEEKVMTLPSAGAALTDLVYRKPSSVRTCSMDLDEEEMLMLEKIAAAEAATEDVRGMALVMRVVINRVLDEEFPDSISGVIMQHRKDVYQFTLVGTGEYGNAQPTQQTEQALDLVLSGWDESCGATYFCTPGAAEKWHEAHLDFLLQYGNHRFYIEKGDGNDAK